MFFFRISMVVLLIFTSFQNGETVKGSSSQTNDMIVQYNSLLNVDTGYSNDDMKKTFNELEEITENAVKLAKEKVYRNLLCSYVFTCRYYMNLITNLIDIGSGGFFKVAFQYDMINASYFKNQIGIMFFVLKHLGTVNSLDPLWLMYAYLDCLKIVASSDLISKQNIKKIILIRHDHDIIYRSLTQFTDNNCPPDNMYNHQYNESGYFIELNKLSFTDTNADTLISILLTDIIETTDNRHTQINQSLSIDNVHTYFIKDDLRLRHIMLDEGNMKILLNDFAEAKNKPFAYKTLQKYCSERNPPSLVSVRSFVEEVGGCLAFFVNLMKYIIARKAMKYVLDVHSTMPVCENGVQSPEELTQWILQSNLETTNKTMLNNFNDIKSFLKIDEDDDLKFLAEMLNSEPRVTFSDSKKNTENRIKNMLDKFSKELHLSSTLKIVRADFDPSYKSQRMAEVLDLAKRLKVDVKDSDRNEYEGMLDLFVFKVFITKLYGDTNFDITHSFFEYQKNYFNQNKNVNTSNYK